MRRKRLLPSVVALLMAVAAIAAAPAAHGTQSSERWTSQLNQLVVAPENRAGYDRDAFGSGWSTQSDGCDTRDHVLRDEATRGTERGCDVRRGVWRSRYDAKKVRNPSRLDIDHMVPLAEAWASGASAWSDQAREDFANDLDYRDALVAVTASTNRSKSDRDPAEWMPPRSGSHCWYAQAWVAVKYKYNLSVDSKEKMALQRTLSRCKKNLVPAVPARYPGLDAPQVPDVSAPTPPPGVARYANCTEARAAGITPIIQAINPELYEVNSHMDRDGDGVACE